MAKGRKLTTSRSERFLGGFRYGHGRAPPATDESELGEEDVWSMVDDVADRELGHVSDTSSQEESVGTGLGQPTDGRHVVGGLSLAFEESGDKTASSRIVHQCRAQDRVASSPRGGRHMATSAPVNVPDWSKILRVDSVESMHDSDDGVDDGDLEMVPPHEYLAREYARSRKMTATSVFEGVGRTLKGRDMSRVRDAVWSQTGFDG